MALLENQLARRDGEGKVEIRTAPLRISWVLDELVSSDGHKLRCTFSATVRALGEPAEQRMLEETFLGRQAWLCTDDLVAHFTPALRSAAVAGVRPKPAEELLAEKSQADLAAALRRSAEAVAFACGMEILAPFAVQLESPTLALQRAQELARAAAERRAAGQVEHFQRAAGLLKQFEAIRHSAPDLSPGDVLKQINADDQSSTLQMLLLAEGRRSPTESIWAVAGSSLVRIDPRAEPPKTQLFAMPSDVGPLRSVSAADIRGRRMLLIGARFGALVLPADQPQEVATYRDAQLESPHGFTRLLVWNDRLWGCHRDGGIVAWMLGEGDKPAITVRLPDLDDGPSPSYLQALDDSHLIFANGRQLSAIDAGGKTTPLLSLKAPAIALLRADGALLVVQEDGLVMTCDVGSASADRLLRVTQEERRAGRVSAATLLPWLGGRRLLLATEDGPILCSGLGDPLVTQYTSAYRGVRDITAAADWLVAISPDRMRLVLWRPWEGRQPAIDLSLIALTRHRLADVELG